MFLASDAPLQETDSVQQRHGWTVETYRDLTEGVGLGLFQTTVGGQVLYVNHRMAELLGYRDVEDLLSCSGDLVQRHYVRQEDRERYRAEMAHKGEVSDWILEIRRCDDTTRSNSC